MDPLTIAVIALCVLVGIPKIWIGIKYIVALWRLSGLLGAALKDIMKLAWKQITRPFISVKGKVVDVFGAKAWRWRWANLLLVWEHVTFDDICAFLAMSTLVVWCTMKVVRQMKALKKRWERPAIIREEKPISVDCEWYLTWMVKCLALLTGIAFFKRWAGPLMQSLTLYKMWNKMSLEGKTAELAKQRHTLRTSKDAFERLASRVEETDFQGDKSASEERINKLMNLGVFFEQEGELLDAEMFEAYASLDEEAETINMAKLMLTQTSGSVFWLFWRWKTFTSAQRRAVLLGAVAIITFVIVWPLVLAPLVRRVHMWWTQPETAALPSVEPESPLPIVASTTLAERYERFVTTVVVVPEGPKVLPMINMATALEMPKKGKNKGRAQDWKAQQASKAAHHKHSSAKGSRTDAGLEYAFAEYTRDFLQATYGMTWDEANKYYRKLREQLSADDINTLATVDGATLNHWMEETFNDYPAWATEQDEEHPVVREDSAGPKTVKNKRKEKQKAKKKPGYVKEEAPIAHAPAVPDATFDAEVQVYDSQGQWHGGGTVIVYAGKVGVELTNHQLNALRAATMLDVMVIKSVRDPSRSLKWTVGHFGATVMRGDYAFVYAPSNVWATTAYKQPTSLGLENGCTSIAMRWYGLDQVTSLDKAHDSQVHNWVPVDTEEFEHELSSNAGASGSGIYAYCHNTRKWWLVGCNRGKAGNVNRGMGAWACLNAKAPTSTPSAL